MKIAVVLGAFSIGSRPLDFHYNNIYESSRGLTGTDLTFCQISKTLAERGHEVHMFTVHAQPNHKPASWHGCRLYNFGDRFQVVDDSFDCIISINEPNVFIGMTDKPLRIVWQFLNDFTFVQSGFDDFVDQYLGVCDMHTEHLKKLTPKPEKWGTLALGCEPNIYKNERVPGRVIWCSSADRGLHWLLSEWPAIKMAVPHASLRIFYHFNYGDIPKIEPQTKSNIHVVEMAQRIRYIKYAIDRLKPFGVEHIGSVSRIQMQKEFSEASTFGFCCDTVAFSEGFSVATMEAHASYTVPIITDQDCLGTVYKDSGAVIIKSPVRDRLPEFTSTVIKSLTDEYYAAEVVEKCRKFSSDYTWSKITEKLENLIFNHPKFKMKSAPST